MKIKVEDCKVSEVEVFEGLKDVPRDCILLDENGVFYVKEGNDVFGFTERGYIFAGEHPVDDDDGPFTLAPSQKITVTFDAT